MSGNKKSTFQKILGNLVLISQNNGEIFKSRAYKKAQEQISIYVGELESVEDIQKVPFIGKSIQAKFEEFIKTGKVEQAYIDEASPLLIFSKVYGIGNKKAQQLVMAGVKTIEGLRERQDELLNDPQKKGLKYYEEILERIPRIEINTYKMVLDHLFNMINTDGKGSYEIVGSYRRGAVSSGDIDIIITHEENDETIFDRWLNELIHNKILIEVLSRGKIKSLGISRLKGRSARRIDFMFCKKEEYPFAILYFTGSKTFNTLMRQRALSQGYSMNEHCICKIVDGKKGRRVGDKFPDERSIFKFLGMVYKTPKERDSVITLDLLNRKRTLKKRKMISPRVTKQKITQKLLDYKDLGLDYLCSKTENTLSYMVKLSNDLYYNKTALLTDNEFDILKEYIQGKYPNNMTIKEIGAPIKKEKKKLPYFMGSMNKIKPDTKAVINWKGIYSGPYVLTGKLDGVSGLYTGTELFTRGNGEYGQDVSYFIDGLGLPKPEKEYVVRGEFIMNKKTFEEKFAGDFSNSRNLVAGVINSKKKEMVKLNAIDFICYEVIFPVMKPSEQMSWLLTNGFKTVKHATVMDITNEYLSTKLTDWRENYEYMTDGVVVSDDKIYTRKNENPKHAFAFKMVLTEQCAEAKVLNVFWNVSVHGYLKPKVQIEPVVIAGVEINYATGHNASFIEKNKIGLGAVVKIIRSGDVIPKITEIIQGAEKPLMPDIPYKWTETKVDIIMENYENSTLFQLKKIGIFFETVGVEGLGPGNIKRIAAGGYDTIEKILIMSVSDLMGVEGFQAKSSEKIVLNIKIGLEKLTLPQLMQASSKFGRGLGVKRIKTIMNTFPDILIKEETTDEKLKRVNSLPGFAKKTSQLFVTHITDFVEFLKRVNLSEKLKEDLTVIKTNHPLTNKKIVFTGFTNKKLECILESYGANVMKVVNKQTDIVLAINVATDSSKANTARELNISLMQVDDFINQFDVNVNAC